MISADGVSLFIVDDDPSVRAPAGPLRNVGWWLEVGGLRHRNMPMTKLAGFARPSSALEHHDVIRDFHDHAHVMFDEQNADLMLVANIT